MLYEFWGLFPPFLAVLGSGLAVIWQLKTLITNWLSISYNKSTAKIKRLHSVKVHIQKKKAFLCVTKNAFLLKNQGYSHSEIAKLLLGDENKKSTVTKWFNKWRGKKFPDFSPIFPRFLHKILNRGKIGEKSGKFVPHRTNN